MAEATSTAEDRALDALTKILESSISPEMIEAQQIILRRLALSGDLFPSRIPRPLNITEVGGYINLLENQPVLAQQVLASALGVAGPNPQLGWEATLPGLFFATRANDRPPGASQPAIPVQLSIRSDFADPFDAAVASLHDVGAVLPVLRTVQPLPPAGPGIVTPPADVLPYLGRTLDLVPATALVAPATDALAVGQPGGGGALQVLARQVDASAPSAGTVAAASWSLWTCDSTSCTQAPVNGVYVPLTPVLNAAGWYQGPLTAPTSLANSGAWYRWTNITGLVAGVTRLGDELAQLYTAGQLAQSSVREQDDWIWDGTAFVAP
jgi:hypothetical protein